MATTSEHATPELSAQVLIGNDVFDVVYLYETVEGQALLERAYRGGDLTITCRCNDNGLRLHPYSTDDGIRLRCDDLTAPLHAWNCFRHGDIAVRSQRARVFERAVSETNGVYSTNLRHALEVAAMTSHPRRQVMAGHPSEQKGFDVKRGSLGLATFLKLMQQTAGLNGNLHGELPADTATFLKRLAQGRSQHIVNRHPAESILAIAGHDDLSRHPRLDYRDGMRTYVIVVGVTGWWAGFNRSEWPVGDDETTIQLVDLDEPLVIQQDRWKAIVGKSGFPDPHMAARGLFAGKGNLYGLFAARVHRDSTGILRISSGALRFAAPGHVMVDSRLEANVAISLAMQRRIFLKPLMYRLGDMCLPDFPLLDTKPLTIIEVVGREGIPKYDMRTESKRRWLETHTHTRTILVDSVSSDYDLLYHGRRVELPPHDWAAVEYHNAQIQGLDWGLSTVLRSVATD